jgi:hypothetical protein
MIIILLQQSSSFEDAWCNVSSSVSDVGATRIGEKKAG